MDNHGFEFTAVDNGVPIKSWTKGVAVDHKARDQLERVARMPFIYKHVAVMPDVHAGSGPPSARWCRLSARSFRRLSASISAAA